MSRVFAPVHLGCCPTAPRCLLCTPRAEAPTAALVTALCEHYGRDGDRVYGAFFGGPPPDAALIDALDGRPFTVRVRPDLLDRQTAEALVQQGCVGVELDALTLSDRLLGRVGRGYRAALVVEMIRGLSELGVEVGVVLAPGLPASTVEDALADAERIVTLGAVDAVRLHPVLVIEGSNLEQWYRKGAYVPMPLDVAVDTCTRMLDILEDGGVRVLRVGVQPGPDGVGRAVAGPLHPSMRELAESARTLVRLRALVDGSPVGAHIVIGCAPKDEGRARGPLNEHLRILRSEYRLGGVEIQADQELPRGTFRVSRCP